MKPFQTMVLIAALACSSPAYAAVGFDDAKKAQLKPCMNDPHSRGEAGVRWSARRLYPSGLMRAQSPAPYGLFPVRLIGPGGPGSSYLHIVPASGPVSAISTDPIVFATGDQASVGQSALSPRSAL